MVAYRRALELDPLDPKTHNNLGVCLSNQGRRDEAIDCFHAAMEIEPEFSPAYSNLGNELRQMHKFDEAISYHHKAIALAPSEAIAHNLFGVTLMDIGRLNEAIASYELAIECDRGFAAAYLNLGNALVAKGKLDDAIDMWRQAIALDPHDPNSYQSLGHGLREKGNLDEAVAAYRKAVELDSRRLEVLAHLSWILGTASDSKLRDARAAANYAQSLVDQAPRDANGWDNLGAALVNSGEYEASVEALERAREIRGDQDPLHRPFLAMAYWGVGRKNDALQEYAIHLAWLIAKNRREEQYRFTAKAETLIGDEDLESFLTDTISARADKTQASHLYDARARLYARQAKCEAASNDYLHVIEQLPQETASNSRTSRYLLGLTQQQEVFETLVRARPENRQLKLALGRRLALCGRWREAADVFLTAAPITLDEFVLWDEIGCLQQLAGDDAGYQVLTREIAMLMDQTKHTHPAFVAARTYGLTEQSAENAERAVRWATASHAATQTPWDVNVLALSQYRAGHYAEALETLAEPEPQNWKNGHPLNWMVLALIHEGLEDAESANRWLGKVDAWLADTRAQDANGPFDVPINIWLMVNTLRRETKPAMVDAQTKAEAASTPRSLAEK